MFFFFNDTATTEIYTLSLHDALPICVDFSDSDPNRAYLISSTARGNFNGFFTSTDAGATWTQVPRSEEHTSELQSRQYLVCRLLLEKKKNKQIRSMNTVTRRQKNPHG